MSLLRIAAAVVIALGVLWAAAFLAIRQPCVAAGASPAAPKASPEVLRRDVEFLTRSRDPEFIEHRFESATRRVRVQEFVVRGREYRNVIASFGPDRPNAPLLVVGAHYDVFSPRDQPFPGADDNASGTAGLLELARLLAANPPSTPVELVAYANEEPPFFASEDMGSAIHAASLRRPVIGMICLEMIGDFHDEQASSSWLLRSLYPRRGNFVAVAGGWDDRVLTRAVKAAMQPACRLPVLSFTGPRSMVDASDQRNYWKHGWQAVMITDTAYLRNPRYHTRRDTAGTLDYDAMAEVVDGVFNAVHANVGPASAPAAEGGRRYTGNESRSCLPHPESL